jgi:tetratricopeptide (TPR) repeat protein
MIARVAAAIAVSALLGFVPARADDPFGTAGSFRKAGWVQCGAPFADFKKGACDPAPVDPTLEPHELVRAHIARARALVSLARMEEARKAADAAVQADPRNVEALAFRARVALSMLQSEPAEHDLNAALLLDPRNPVLLATRAELLLGRDKTQAALEDVTAAQELRPADFDVLWIKARVYMALGQLGRAEEDLGRALLIEPDERRARLFRAQLRLRRGKFEDAIEDATVILREHPDSSALEVRAIANTALDRRAEAVNDLDQMLGPPGDPMPSVIGPYFHDMRLQRIMLLAQLGRHAEAAKDIDTLLSTGGKPGTLRLQVYLRQHGFPDVALNGERTSLFDEALKACLLNQACARGLSQRS